MRLALEAGEVEHALRAYAALAWRLLDDLEPAEAARYATAGIALADRAEHIGFLQYLTVERAMIALAGARWDEAIRYAQVGLTAAPPVRCAALTVLNRALLRSGRPDPDSIEETWQLAQSLGELQRIGPAAVLVCEEAWLRDDLDRIRQVAAPVQAEAARRGVPATQAELEAVADPGGRDRRLERGLRGSAYAPGRGPVARGTADLGRTGISVRGRGGPGR